MNSSESPDPAFALDFVPLDDPDTDEGVRWSTWLSVQPLCRGPEPLPDWVVTSQAALDTDLGVLKTGKEADAFLLERAIPGSTAVGESVVMVAKRYRGEEHRDFHRSAAYADGRKVRRSRDNRAMAKRTSYGRQVAAGQWAWAEWEALQRCWKLGLAVPYPVQLDGTELLMEWITDESGETAPRLAQVRPEPELVATYFAQLEDFIARLADAGLAHGDLSPYNILATGERLVVIDMPQIIDLVANPAGLDLLLRDCVNVCTWFQARGLDVDPQELFARVLPW